MVTHTLHFVHKTPVDGNDVLAAPYRAVIYHDLGQSMPLFCNTLFQARTLFRTLFQARTLFHGGGVIRHSDSMLPQACALFEEGCGSDASYAMCVCHS